MAEQIIIKNAHFQYPRGGFKFDCENFALNTGEISLILGKNGCGKTTLLKLCCGILKADGSSLHMFGEDMSSASLGSIGKHVGYLFQEPSRQIFCATVWDEMTFVGAMLEQDDIANRAMSLLERFNLKHLIRRGTHRLSRGEKQRLALAAILMQDIKFLMLDEPTTGLDAKNRARLYEEIKKLVGSGVGVAIISHDNELIREFSYARQVHIKEGKLSEKL